jgi:hypothetical protein
MTRADRKHGAGRPRVRVTPQQVRELRLQGVSWRRIGKLLNIGTATAIRLLQACEEDSHGAGRVATVGSWDTSSAMCD